MTTYTDNLRIPHLDQNVAQPEIPENTAKNVIDIIIAGQLLIDMPDDDYTFTQVDNSVDTEDWQYGLIEMIDTTTPLTAPRDIILPANKRPYIFVNSTVDVLTFKLAGQLGVALQPDSNMYAMSNGIDIVKLEFAPSGGFTKIEEMQDSPAGYGVDGQVLATDGINTFSFIDIISEIGLSSDVTAGYGIDGQVLITNGINAFTYADIISEIGLSTDVTAGYGIDGQVLITNGIDAFTYADIISEIGLSTDVTAGYGANGQVLVTNGTDAFTYSDFIVSTELIGPIEVQDDIDQFGNLFTGTATVNFSTGVTTGTGLMYGTQGIIGIDTNIEYFSVKDNQTVLLGANTVVTHADASSTTLNNPEYMAQNAQRTADIALKNTLDINMAIDTLSKASKITLTLISGDDYTFVITP